MNQSKRFVVELLSRRPNVFGIWDRDKGEYVRHMQDEDQPYIESPFPHALEKIKNKLRHD